MGIANAFAIALLFSQLFTFTYATKFDIVNKCSYTVWAAASPGGGQKLDPGQTWSISVSSSTAGRIWGRTNCTFDSNGQGRCETGDCNGTLQCQGSGSPPYTLVEYALNQPGKVDFYDISLVDGFNIPVDFSPTAKTCRGARCAGDITGECPAELQAPGGCNNPCEVFQTNEYCCFSGPCGPNKYSRFFKEKCPDAFVNPDASSPFVCPSGTNYRVEFCPS